MDKLYMIQFVFKIKNPVEGEKEEEEKTYFLFTTLRFQSVRPRHVIQRIGHLDRRNPFWRSVSALYDNTSDVRGLSKIYLTRQCINRRKNYQQIPNKYMNMNITINYFNLDTEQKAEIQVYTITPVTLEVFPRSI